MNMSDGHMLAGSGHFSGKALLQLFATRQELEYSKPAVSVEVLF